MFEKLEENRPLSLCIIMYHYFHVLGCFTVLSSGGCYTWDTWDIVRMQFGRATGYTSTYVVINQTSLIQQCKWDITLYH